MIISHVVSLGTSSRKDFQFECKLLELAQFPTHLLLRYSACDFSDMVRSSSSMVQSCFGLIFYTEVVEVHAYHLMVKETKHHQRPINRQAHCCRDLT